MITIFIEVGNHYLPNSPYERVREETNVLFEIRYTIKANVFNLLLLR
ncbi:uncharacterized protein FFMR_08693 [Fusarium fujikuroi]|nr:uncharacterized protein FFM5_05815 [Fusarium fujikuroi]SCO46746.1 uncharacterized protein FFMR_08693 [Fusarium fujikuroi]